YEFFFSSIITSFEITTSDVLSFLDILNLSVCGFQGTIPSAFFRKGTYLFTLLTDALSAIRNRNPFQSLITGKTSSIATALPCW
ncbi:hypothetical protein, partial [Murimonas intestini]|uniref:hypothetical protein n=1 Tax=Murimonas intestini TaxID=1337051 RepID=UPI001A9B6173